MKMFFNIVLVICLFIFNNGLAQQDFNSLQFLKQSTQIKEVKNSDYNKDSTYSYVWDEGTNDWFPDERYAFHYDSKGNLLSEVFSIWKTNYDNWGYKYKDEFKYNEYSEVLEHVGYRWQTGQNIWINDIKETYLYYGYKDSIVKQTFEISSDLTQWEKKRQYIDVLNSDGQKAETYCNKWSDSQNNWLQYYKVTFSYENYLKSQVLVEDWDTINKDYVLDYRTQYIYDSNGNAINIIDETYNNTNDSWRSNWIKTSFYNQNNLPSEENVAFWSLIDFHTNEYGWDTAARVFFDYRIDNLLHQTTVYNWDEEQKVWIHKKKYVFKYDNNSNLIEEIHSSFNTVTQEWTNSSREQHFYSKPSKLSDTKTSKLTFYPNPSSDYINIQKPGLNDYYVLTIYLLDGTKMLQSDIKITEDSYRLDINHLPSGMYLINISDKQHSYSQQLVILSSK